MIDFGSVANDCEMQWWKFFASSRSTFMHLFYMFTCFIFNHLGIGLNMFDLKAIDELLLVMGGGWIQTYLLDSKKYTQVSGWGGWGLMVVTTVQTKIRR